MGILRLLNFYREATTYIAPDSSAVERSGADGDRHTTYHRRIVWTAGLAGAAGAAGGLAFTIAALQGPPTPDGAKVWLGPVMFGAAGLLVGAAVACALAPRAFLTGPIGEKWMRLIGTRSVPVARGVCLAVALVVTLPIIGLGVLIAVGK